MVVEQVLETIRRHDLIGAGDTVLVGVSGGADSLTLLHVLSRLQDRLGIGLVAATLDHGIRGAESEADVAYVQQIAEQGGIPIFTGKADVPAIARRFHLGIEEAARQVRYTFLLRVAQRVGATKIAVGHNRDDQAETVLMHLIRGSGLNGLRGMLPAAPISDYHLLEMAEIEIVPEKPEQALRPVLIRPLLETPRSAINAYVVEQGIIPRQDSTNADVTYFRNRLRHEVIPLLETLNPNLRAMLARTADTLREDAAWVASAGESAVERTVRETGSDWVRLDRAAWDRLSLAEKRHVIRAVVWSLRPALRDVSFIHVQNAVEVASGGGTGTAATLPGGLELRSEYQTLWIGPAESSAPLIDAPALLEEPADFGVGERVRFEIGGWTFEARPLAPGEDIAAIHVNPLAAALAIPAGAVLKLRTRQRGDRFMPRGMGGRSQKLSDTFINMRIPAEWRDRVPLLVINEQIAWFVAPTEMGLRGRMADSFDLGKNTDIVVASWQK